MFVLSMTTPSITTVSSILCWLHLILPLCSRPLKWYPVCRPSECDIITSLFFCLLCFFIKIPGSFQVARARRRTTGMCELVSSYPQFHEGVQPRVLDPRTSQNKNNELKMADNCIKLRAKCWFSKGISGAIASLWRDAPASYSVAPP